MAQIFPAWMDRRLKTLTIVGAVSVVFLAAAASQFLSPEFTDVGYQPLQPIAFSHRLHAGELEIDCRYCHTSVEVAAVASVPTVETCMNCHRLVGRDNDLLALLRESSETGEPVRWIRVHKVPEYAYFHHGVHISAGVGCLSCHGDVAAMEEVRQVETLSMSWCLDCHRRPGASLRSGSEITNAAWRSQAAAVLAVTDQPGRHRPDHHQPDRHRVDPPIDCTGCHR